MIDKSDLKILCGKVSIARVETFYQPLVDAMQEFDINTPNRVAAFMGQILHESGRLLYTEEIASGHAYNGRADLGNTHPGDGEKYKGRGLLQVTGRNNYISVMLALGVDCLEHPEILAEPVNACRASAWWWKQHNLNQLADLGTQGAFKRITKIINGGYNGWEDRLAIYNKAREVLKC
jgi:putative chitinase